MCEFHLFIYLIL